MMKIKYWFFIFSFALLHLTCTKTNPIPVRGFYYWKSQFTLNSSERASLDTLHISSLYVRIFDVDWDFNYHQAIPKGSQINPPIFPKGVQPIPTIYLTNRSLQRTSTEGIDTLAQKILDYTDSILKKWTIQPKKIQLDADWTQSTKDKYFKLLRLIKTSKAFHQVSTTIRLHQYKYPEKTGIPPADEGILMCYNTGKIKEWSTNNSIATIQDIDRYLQQKKTYAIPLGVALPIFSWTVIFRDSIFFKIVSDGDLSWQQDTTHYKKIGTNRYRVRSNTFLSGHFLYEGDLLRHEFVAPEALSSIAKRLQEQPYFKEVLLYHLEEKHLKNYGLPMFENIFDTFE